jgi:hypothetical protein
VQAHSIKTRVENAPGVCNQRSKLKRDEPLPNFAFNFNLRRYTEAAGVPLEHVHAAFHGGARAGAGGGAQPVEGAEGAAAGGAARYHPPRASGL